MEGVEKAIPFLMVLLVNVILTEKCRVVTEQRWEFVATLRRTVRIVIPVQTTGSYTKNGENREALRNGGMMEGVEKATLFLMEHQVNAILTEKNRVVDIRSHLDLHVVQRASIAASVMDV